jgi:hypothetical protein
MAKLDKRWTAAGCALTAVILSASVILMVFGPHFKNLRNDITRESKVLQEERALLAKKTSLQVEWEEKKNFFYPGLEPEGVLNAWVKDLLTSAQSQALALEKLEPAGIKPTPDGKRLTVFISFQGDIRKFARFVYHLIHQDPLSRIEALNIRLEEGSRTLSFELMLGKIVK